jgi:DNA-binding transcriptional MerR regulator
MMVTYSTQQIIEATGLPKRTVQFWTTEGVLLPADRSRGSGVQNRFKWSEIEIAKLLGELSKRRLHSDELSRLSAMFRKTLNLADGGFLSQRAELLKYAETMIDGGGPSLFGPRGDGAGTHGPTTEQRKRHEERLKQTKMTEEEAPLFWCFVAHGLATRKKRPAAWLIWFAQDGSLTMHARFPKSEENSAHGKWHLFEESDHPARGSGIIVDLLLLTESAP